MSPSPERERPTPTEAVRVRRSRFLFFRLDEVSVSDLLSLFPGAWAGPPVPRLRCLSGLTDREDDLSREELTILWHTPSGDWTTAGELSTNLGIGEEHVFRLVERGLLVSDRDAPIDTSLRRREEGLRGTAWYPWAAAFHAGTKWADQKVLAEPPEDDRDLARQVAEGIAEAAEEAGSVPPHFADAGDGAERIALRIPDTESDFFDLLAARKTVREFASARPLSSDAFATILRGVWGCHGIDRVADAFAVLKKTSPSAGALHPTEVYPLALNVQGVPCGLYHYEVSSHSLSLRREIGSREARTLADDFTAGQHYPRSAHALFLMVARFDRSFWKYREHSKAYRTLLLDAGHLSQTFYLVCTALGLGPFFTAAINEAQIEEALALDPAREGVLGVCGCGLLPDRELVLSMTHRDYDPTEGGGRRSNESFGGS